jgi:branched-chain amino acid transport system substrate-binding protein
MLKTPLARIVATATALVFSVGCVSGTAGTSNGKSAVYKVGLLNSLTGRFGVFGVPLQDSLSLAVEQINKSGGFKVGDTTYTLKLDAVDDRSDQQTAVAGATQLMRDNQDSVIFGPIGPLAPAIAELTQPTHVIQFTASSAASTTAGKTNYRQLFAVQPGLALRIKTLVQAIQKFAPNAKKVAVVGPNDETGAAVVPALQPVLQAAGMSLIQSTYPLNTTDLSAILTRLAAQKPDVIIQGWAAQDRSTQLKQFDAAGIAKDATLFMYAGASDDCKLSGGRPCIYHPFQAADLTGPTAPPKVKQLVSDFLAFTNQKALPPQPQVITWYWDPIFMLTAAMKQAGTTTDNVKIADALRALKYDGVVGPVSFGATDDAIVQGFAIFFVDASGNTTSQIFQ